MSDVYRKTVGAQYERVLGRIVESGAVQTHDGQRLPNGILVTCSAEDVARSSAMWGKQIVVLPFDELAALTAQIDSLLASQTLETAAIDSALKAARSVALCYDGGGKEERLQSRLGDLREALAAYDEARDP